MQCTVLGVYPCSHGRHYPCIDFLVCTAFLLRAARHFTCLLSHKAYYAHISQSCSLMQQHRCLFFPVETSHSITFQTVPFSHSIFCSAMSLFLFFPSLHSFSQLLSILILSLRKVSSINCPDEDPLFPGVRMRAM